MLMKITLVFLTVVELWGLEDVRLPRIPWLCLQRKLSANGQNDCAGWTLSGGCGLRLWRPSCLSVLEVTEK